MFLLFNIPNYLLCHLTFIHLNVIKSKWVLF